VSRSIIRTVPPLRNASLLSLYNEQLYGSFFTIVRATDDIAIIPLEDVLRKAVVVLFYNDFIVTDIMPFEHNYRARAF
jgi:hypothetical protein